MLIIMLDNKLTYAYTNYFQALAFNLHVTYDINYSECDNLNHFLQIIDYDYCVINVRCKLNY